jgi:hypothetical protein
MPANVEELSNDDLLVQLNELCEEVGWRIIEYLQAVDRDDKLAEGAGSPPPSRARSNVGPPALVDSTV